MTNRKPTHPGAVLLEDVIKPLGLTITEAAKMLGVSRKTLSEFVNEKAMLSPDMAIRIAKATNTSPESWMNMQQKLTLWEAEQHLPENVIPFPSVHSEEALHYKCNNKWGCRLAKTLLMRQPRCTWSMKWVASFARNMPCTKCPLRYPSQAAPSNCATWQAVCPSA